MDANYFALAGGNFLYHRRYVSFLEAAIVFANHASVFSGSSIAGDRQRACRDCGRHRSVDSLVPARGEVGIDRVADCRFPREYLYGATS